MGTTKNTKDQIINIRVTCERKQQIKENAEKLGMNISSYLDYLESHQPAIDLPYVKELAQEVYHLNNRLNELSKYPSLPVQELRDTMSKGILIINSQMKAGI